MGSSGPMLGAAGVGPASSPAPGNTTQSSMPSIGVGNTPALTSPSNVPQTPQTAPTNPYSYQAPPAFNPQQDTGLSGLQNFGQQSQQTGMNDLNWMLWNMENPQYANWAGSPMAPLAALGQNQPQQPITNTGINPQQGALQGLPGLTNTASPNVTGGSTFQNVLTQSGQAGPPQTPFSNAVTNVLADI